MIDDHRLAYLADALVNWCPGLGTVLANEEVTADGRSRARQLPGVQAAAAQWMMRITAYADRLLDDLDLLDWPETIKTMQRNWIGRSRRALVSTSAIAADARSRCSPPGPDTLFGATYMVLAPEHPLVDELTAADWPDGPDELRRTWTGGRRPRPRRSPPTGDGGAAKSDLERQAEAKDKTGVFTGAYATNPVNGGSVPVFIADYVLMGYGTGRDHGGARRTTSATGSSPAAFGLPIVRSRRPAGRWPIDLADWPRRTTGDGALVNSATTERALDGLSVAEAKAASPRGWRPTAVGEAHGHYKLRDWLFSRQRYWGEPFPIVYDDDGPPHRAARVDAAGRAARDRRTTRRRRSTPTTPTASRSRRWPGPPTGSTSSSTWATAPSTYSRETNMMPQWAGCCWYELRYLDPTNAEAFVDPENEAYWMGPTGASGPTTGGVDLYVGGVEHAVLHLLYARFWHKVLLRPGPRLVARAVPPAVQPGLHPGVRLHRRPRRLRAGRRGRRARRRVLLPGRAEVDVASSGKIGKSLKNAVSPDDICDDYGADTLRLYEMSMGPLDASRPWAHQRRRRRRTGSCSGCGGTVVDEQTGDVAVIERRASTTRRCRLLHRTIDGGRATTMARLRFNTAIAKLIELNNHLTEGATGDAPRAVGRAAGADGRAAGAAHRRGAVGAAGPPDSLAHEPFPVADPALLVRTPSRSPCRSTARCVTSEVPADADAALSRPALADEKVRALLAGATPKKVIVVPGRLLNLVI